MKFRMGTFVTVIAVSLAVGVPAAIGKDQKVYPVCAHGCKYRTISAAVKAVKDGSNSVIKIRPGTYKEGVTLVGHKYDGLTFVGSSRQSPQHDPRGQNAKLNGDPRDRPERHRGHQRQRPRRSRTSGRRTTQSNGFFVHADDRDDELRRLPDEERPAPRSTAPTACSPSAATAAGSRSRTAGGMATRRSTSARRRRRRSPKWTSDRPRRGYENVLGYSGTNSKYVNIHESDFYNNGAGIVPNTLDTEGFEPNGDRDRSTTTTSSGTTSTTSCRNSRGQDRLRRPRADPATATINYPTGVGVVLFGADGWTVKDNKIFGNFKWGAAAFSDPFNDGDDANQEQPDHRQPDGPQRHRHEPVRLLQRRLGQRQLLRGQHVSSTFEPTSERRPTLAASVPGLPGSRPGHRRQPATEHSAITGAGRRARRATCAATRPASSSDSWACTVIRRSRTSRRSTRRTPGSAHEAATRLELRGHAPPPLAVRGGPAVGGRRRSRSRQRTRPRRRWSR